VTSTDIIGGVNETTGAYEGVHALLGAESEVHVTPRIICVPGYTHDRPSGQANPVVAELLGIADSLRAVIIADGPNTTDAAAITYREDWGSERVYVVDPWVKVWDEDADDYVDMPASARVAGLIAKTDDEKGFWWSPSNQDLYGIGGSSRAVEFSLGDPNCRANLLNENEVTTIIHRDGYRLWGNRTCSSDAKWAFLNVVRIRDMLHESLLQAHLWAVDRNITKTYVEDVLEGVRSYGRSLIAKEAILGFSAWLDEDLNTPESIASGQIYIDFDFTPAYPAERITFRSHLVNDYISNIFD
jgi:phage tail sheath protein FI